MTTPRLTLVLALAGVSGAAHADPALTTVRVASGLRRPLFVTHAPGDFGRVFIVEQRGSGGVADQADIRILDLTDLTLRPDPFLRVRPVSNTSTERGLLGLAFHPDYADNGLFYFTYSTNEGDRGERFVLARAQVSPDPDLADPASVQIVLEIPNPGRWHYGGWIGFGPDGYLYVSRGDGGVEHDPDHNAQNPHELLGKLLRLDVNGDAYPEDPLRNYAIPPSNPFADGASGAPEVWAVGLRNPWRCAFDAATGDLWISDVGQNKWEEINVQPASSAGGESYGWRCYEGPESYHLDGCSPIGDHVFPIHSYAHVPACAVAGGYVYRGCAMPELHGTYFFGDYCTGQVWSLRYDGSAVTDLTDRTAELAPGGGLTIANISSFGTDAYGELYIVDNNATNGEVYRIVPAAPHDTDCNGNGVPDACEILDGSAPDADGNGVPDACDETCPGDFNGDGALTIEDFSAFRAAYLAGDLRCDYNGSGALDAGDFSAFRSAYLAGCP